MQHLEVSGAVRHIYIYVIRQLKVKQRAVTEFLVTEKEEVMNLYKRLSTLF